MGSRDRSKGADAAENDGYARSFGALKDSVVQGHGVRKREKELRKYHEQTDRDRSTHADQADILERYDEIVAEQQQQLDTLTNEHEEGLRQLSSDQAELKRTQTDLDELKERHRSELDKLKTQHDLRVGEAQDAYDQVRENRRNIQSQIDELKSDETSAESAQVVVLKQQLADAKAAEKTAKDVLNTAKSETKRSYRDAKQERDDVEQPKSDRIEELRTSIRRLEAELETNKEKQDQVSKRISYCAQVRDNPAQVEKLRADIVRREQRELEMSAELDALSREHAHSKASAGKAKLVVVLGIIAVIAVIVIVLIVGNALQSSSDADTGEQTGIEQDAQDLQDTQDAGEQNQSGTDAQDPSAEQDSQDAGEQGQSDAGSPDMQDAQDMRIA